MIQLFWSKKKKKKSKSDKKNEKIFNRGLKAFGNLFTIILLAVYVFGMFQGASVHEGMLHNIDLTYNVLRIGQSVQRHYHINQSNVEPHWITNSDDVWDRYQEDKSLPLTTLYIRTMNNIREIFLLTNVLSFITGGLLIVLYSNLKQ